jgi:hypothetical protein
MRGAGQPSTTCRPIPTPASPKPNRATHSAKKGFHIHTKLFIEDGDFEAKQAKSNDAASCLDRTSDLVIVEHLEKNEIRVTRSTTELRRLVTNMVGIPPDENPVPGGNLEGGESAQNCPWNRPVATGSLSSSRSAKTDPHPKVHHYLPFSHADK